MINWSFDPFEPSLVADRAPIVRKTDIFDRYRSELCKCSSLGKVPSVCIAGSHDYDQLVGYVKLLFGVVFDPKIPPGHNLEVFGVQIFRSPNEETGFHFGVLPDKNE